ncbi:MAG TPA: YerC/YecD family TrpR-related protein [Acidobacteriota bacterium]|nr:YerC/YecD family TrpR-related protein [Acidobacteriota bacterium]
METSLQDNANFRSLVEALLQLKDADECARFLRDLCTVGELEAMAERWYVVQLIEQGLSYRQVSEQSGASTATIARVAHWLKHGEGGYRLLLDRLAKSDPKRK